MDEHIRRDKLIRVITTQTPGTWSRKQMSGTTTTRNYNFYRWRDHVINSLPPKRRLR